MSREWPYPALLTQSVKAYPIVPVMRRIGPQAPARWPGPMGRRVAAWRDRIGGEVCNQIYVHVPFCPFLCHFCPLYKVQSPRDRKDDVKERYVASLLTEIDRWATDPQLAGVRFDSIYLGGGTPTELLPEQLVAILARLRQRLDVAPDAEITLEGVARQMLGTDYLAQLVAAGVNRVSFGIQSLDDDLRRRIGRGDDVADYADLFATARQRWPALSINTEIMAGLPEQTLESLERDLQQLVRWSPNSLDILYYVLMPGTKLQRLVTLGRRGGPDLGANMLAARALINRVMADAGYEQRTGEVFVRDDRDLFTRASFGGSRHRLNTVLALGPSAFGLVAGTAYQNAPDLAAWTAAIVGGRMPIERAEALSVETARRRAQLFSVLELRPELAVFDRGRDRRLLARWARDGLIELGPDGARLTPTGMLWYNHLQMDLLPVQDLVRTLGMFGSLAEQRDALRRDRETLPPHQRDLLATIRGRGLAGWLRFGAYRTYLRYAGLRRRDRAALGFTGPVAE